MDTKPYFARKSNVFNQYFVKMLWLWVTGAFLIHIVTLYWRRAKPQQRVQAILRYFLVTCAWIATTQWFFGPPLIDRSFTLTGGQCELVQAGEYNDEPAKELFTAAACKVAGGDWSGGHDISGHVFILVLGSTFLIMEALPVLKMLVQKRPAVLEEKQRDKVEDRKAVVRGELQDDETAWVVSLSVVSAVVGTALWMLAMTVTYFHTWREKLSGLLVALASIGFVYILPGYVSSLEAVVGRPGL